MCSKKASLQFIHDIVQMQASDNPEAISVYLSDDQAVTYAELWRQVGECAAWLRESGVVPGDRVMVVGENGLEMIVFTFACSV